MKEITITRKRAFADGLGRQYVYVEDGRSFDLVMDEKCWAYCGDLLNGETKTFRVPDTSERILLLAGYGPMTKLVGVEEWILPEGDKVALSGRCVFNPLTGSAFRFDGEPGAEIAEKRRRCAHSGAVLWGTVVLLLGALTLLTIFLLSSTRDKPAEETRAPVTSHIETVAPSGTDAAQTAAPGREYSGSGITVTLPASFGGEVTPIPGLGDVLLSGDLGVMFGEKTYVQEPALKEMSLADYAERTRSRAGANATLTWDGDMPVIEYGFGTGSEGLTLLIYIFKGQEAFRTLQFVILSSSVDVERTEASALAKTAVLVDPL